MGAVQMPGCQKCAKDEPLFNVKGQLLCEGCARRVRNVQLQAQGKRPNPDVKELQKIEGKSCFVVMAPRNRHLAGILGCIILAIGVFMPLVQLPFVGSVTYIANSKVDGVIILLLAAASAFFVLKKQYKPLYYTSMGSFLLIGLTFVNFQNKIAEFHRMLDGQIKENSVNGIADATAATIQLDFGWAFLGIGALLLLIAAAANDNVRQS